MNTAPHAWHAQGRRPAHLAGRFFIGASSGSAAQQKIDHSYQSAVGQSGLAAGEGGFDLAVKGDTRLTGAAITSEAPEDQNRLVTRSLGYEDLTNRQKTKASSQSLALAGGFNLGSSPTGSGTPGGNGTSGANTAARDPMQGAFSAAGTSAAGQLGSNLLANLAGNAALPKNQNETSQTKSVISPARITITGTGNAETDEQSRQAAQTLTGRDPATANQTLSNTLKLQDAARLEQKLKEAQQTAQAASLVGQVAAGIIGDLAAAMRKPVDDAQLRQQLDAKQAEGKALSNVERYELARLDKDGMTSAQAEKTLADPAARANYANWQEGSVNKIVLHDLAGVLTAQVGNGNVLVGASAGAVNEALIPAMSDYLEAKGIRPGSEEYKGYMQLGSAMLGAGVGALAGGSKTTQNAALGGTVAHNATTYNYLSHSENEARLKAARACQGGDKSAFKTRDEWNALDQKRDADLRTACNADGNSAACSTQYAAMLVAYESYKGKSDVDYSAALKAGLEKYSAKAERESFNNLLNVPHYDAKAIAMAATAITTMGNLALDLTPVVGDVKAFAEANTKFEYALAVIGALGPVGDGAKALIKEAKVLYEAGEAAKAVEKVTEAERSLSSGYYDSKAIRDNLGAKHGVENVQSTTVANNPPQRVTSDPAKGVEVISNGSGKAVVVNYKDPVTGEAMRANIPYDSRGLPVFDDVSKYTTKIDNSVPYEQQFRKATQDLRDAINSGKVDPKQFTPEQLSDIQKGADRIRGYTWHHNAQSAPHNMQLIPMDVHKPVSHLGQGALSQGK